MRKRSWKELLGGTTEDMGGGASETGRREVAPRAVQHSAPRAYERALATRPCATYEEHACADKGSRAMVMRKGTIEARRTLKREAGRSSLERGAKLNSTMR